MAKVLINFRSTEEQRERFKRAAEAENMNLSQWLRRLAFQRVGELGERVLRERDNNGANR